MRAKIHGLFVFGKISGLVVGIQMMTGIDISDTGLFTNVFNTIAKTFDVDPLVSLIITIVLPITNILTIVHHAVTAIEHKGRGIGVSLGGFFGMLTIVLGSLGGTTNLALIGVIIIIVTIFGANYKFDD